MIDKIYEIVRGTFDKFGFPLQVDRQILPEDNSTLFICAGMQKLKPRFLAKDGGRFGSLQSCIRTNDLDQVGDGTHLTYFEMLGNFSFGNDDYDRSVEMWVNILTELKIPVDSVHVHPKSNHHKLWKYSIVEDTECEWSDGEIGGYCCEIYSRGIEVGNLVNPLGHSTDVGFGWERMLMILEGKERIDETSLFDISLPPICRDHVRTLSSFWENKVAPSNKKQGYVCRRLLRKVLQFKLEKQFIFQEWLDQEQEMRDKCLERAKKLWKRNQDKPLSWWYETVGLLPDEVKLIEWSNEH